MLAIQLRGATAVATTTRKTSIATRHTIRLAPIQQYLVLPGPRTAAAAAATLNDDLQPQVDAELNAEPNFASPTVRHMHQITGKERAALRAHSESLAKARTLQRLQVGAQGITYNVLVAAMDVLMKHEYLRIRLGAGCGLERKQTARLLYELLDAVVVSQVGFTITLYRKKGLPRPDNLIRPAAKVA